MKKKNENANKKSFEINDPQIYQTHGGEVIKGKASVVDLLQHVEYTPHPAQPWTFEETHRRWEESLSDGHLQLLFKCTNCSLEFVTFSLRSEVEALEAYQPSHGQNGGLCRKVTCPECGQRETSLLLRYRRHEGPIYGFFSQPNPDQDNRNTGTYGA